MNTENLNIESSGISGLVKWLETTVHTDVRISYAFLVPVVRCRPNDSARSVFVRIVPMNLSSLLAIMAKVHSAIKRRPGR